MQTTWQASYTEIESAQAIIVPWWLKFAQRRGPYSQIAVRLNMGEWRLRVIIMTLDIERVLGMLEDHGVHVARAPIRLNRFWIGRK